MTQDNVYVVGDGGIDIFKVDKARSFRVKAGAPFIAEVLANLLGTATTKCLVEDAGADHAASSAYPALRPKTAELKRYDKVWRIGRYGHEGDGNGDDRNFCLKSWAKLDAKFLVAHNAYDAWPTPDAADAHATLIENFLCSFGKQKQSFPPIIVNLSDKLPRIRRPGKLGNGIEFESKLWETLRKHCSSVAIVTSLTALRQADAFVTRRLSWEQGIEDLAAELHRLPQLQALTQFRHLFVRLGMVGFLHVEHCEVATASSPLTAKVYFSPYADRGVHRDHEAEGGTIGRNTLFIAALLRHLLKGEEEHLRYEVFARSLEAMRRVDDLGYSDEIVNSAATEDSGDRLIRALADCAKKVFDVAKYEAPDVGSPDTLAECDVPGHVLAAPPPNSLRTPKRWHMLDEALMGAPVHRINVAMAIVMGGHAKVLNRRWDKDRCEGIEPELLKLLSRVEYHNPKDRAPDYVTLQPGDRPALPDWPSDGPDTPQIIGTRLHEGFEICVPVTKFADLFVIERDEIETMRGIYNLLGLYRSQVKRTAKIKPPISIAVFGAPGSGKSYAVKMIAQGLGGAGEIPVLEFNLSQFRGLEDLASAFGDVVKVRNNRPDVTPLVFFDEFDCVWEGRELGWLKYFLAPMQDGKFQNRDAEIGPAIFVFAGGVYTSFERFDPTTDSTFDNLRELDEYKHRLKGFVEQKGPDFISRLRGRINVLEINDAQGRVKHFIRRAMQLRGLLAKNGRVDNNGQARINDAIVYALLTVDRYRHGVRSMQAIVEMCAPIYDRIEIASLPPRAQLNMHVDADEFLIRVQRGRLRKQPEWQPNDT